MLLRAQGLRSFFGPFQQNRRSSELVREESREERAQHKEGVITA